MIKTLVFTQSFKQNLSKFGKLQTNLAVNPSDNPKTEVISSINQSVQNTPKFKSDNTIWIGKFERKAAEIPPLQYETIERAFDIKPNLSEDVRKAKSDFYKDIEGLGDILQNEQENINKVRAQQEKLMRTLIDQDSRQHNRNICQQETAGLYRCWQKKDICVEELSLFKNCRNESASRINS